MLVVISWIAEILFSPTRAFADFVKIRWPDRYTWFIRLWNWAFFLLAPATCLLLYRIPALLSCSSTYILYLYLWAVPISRINEVFYAFLRDALVQLRGRHDPQTEFTPADRLTLAMRSYLEVVGDFAILYFFLPSPWFKDEFRTIIDAFYFSGVTITTVGYGDIRPVDHFAQLLALYEIFGGLVLVVVTVGAYIGEVSRSVRVKMFAYGSNMCEGKLRCLVGSATFITVARLGSHALRFHKRSTDGSGKADAFETGRAEDIIWGVLYEIDRADKVKLDKDEKGYLPREVEVHSLDGKMHKAWTYSAEQAFIVSSLKPYSWYKRFIVEGARQHNLPVGYIAFLDAVESIEDPDRERDQTRRLITC